MEKAELLSEFSSRVDRFERYQDFIGKARAQANRFSAAVVEKVIQDNEARSMTVVEEIIPLIGDMEAVVADLTGTKDGILNGRHESQFALEELELRLAIGEMTDEDFESESSQLKEDLGSIDTQVNTIDEELAKYQAVLERWASLGQEAGVLKDAGDEEEPDVLDVDLDEPEDEEAAEEPDDVEDLSAVFDSAADDGEVIEVGEANDVDLDDDAGEIDIFSDDEGVAIDEDGEELRRAVLLYQEGTAEEQIYPFNGEVMTLGRGRDNDIQVKNDSKVSRYHCKLYRRGPNFYIEDNKSANGTLVNGELITERRLFGGEEIIIGETFFRFRIMD